MEVKEFNFLWTDLRLMTYFHVTLKQGYQQANVENVAAFALAIFEF
jgi:hypothetical protein